MMDWTNKLKNKMEGYTEQPSDSVWAGISAAAGLTGNKRRAVPLWLLASSAIAAAALFGAMLIFNAKEDVPATMTAEAVKVGQEPVVSAQVVQDNYECSRGQSGEALCGDGGEGFPWRGGVWRFFR